MVLLYFTAFATIESIGVARAKEKVNQAKILADIKRQKTIEHFNKLNRQLAKMGIR